VILKSDDFKNTIFKISLIKITLTPKLAVGRNLWKFKNNGMVLGSRCDVLAQIKVLGFLMNKNMRIERLQTFPCIDFR
jgi:hypothetical protein